MADGSITFHEFLKLSMEERCVRYADLSEHDKFLARISFPPATDDILPCNYCKHYHGFAKCDAFPNGISREQILRVEENRNTICKDDIKFEPEEENEAKES